MHLTISAGDSVVKNLPANAGDTEHMSLISGLGRSPEGEKEPTLVFLPGVIHGQRTLLGFSPWGCKIKLTCTHLHIQSCMHTHMYSSG